MNYYNRSGMEMRSLNKKNLCACIVVASAGLCLETFSAEKVEVSKPIYRIEKPEAYTPRKQTKAIDSLNPDFSGGANSGETPNLSDGISAPELNTPTRRKDKGTADDNWILKSPDSFSSSSVEEAFGVRDEGSEIKEEKPTGFLELYLHELNEKDEAAKKTSIKPSNRTERDKDEKDGQIRIERLQNKEEDITGVSLNQENENLVKVEGDLFFERANRISDSLDLPDGDLPSPDKIKKLQEDRTEKIKEFSAILDGPKGRINSGDSDFTRSYLERDAAPGGPTRVQTSGSTPLNNNLVNSPLGGGSGSFPTFRGAMVPSESGGFQQNISRPIMTEMPRERITMMDKPVEVAPPRRSFSTLDAPTLGTRR